MIELRGIRKIYPGEGGGVTALRDIDLTVREGEYLAIVGQSGSGKSTLMNILGCLDLPSGGTYLLRGKNVTAYNSRERAMLRNREIGFVFQGFHLSSRLTALANVELPLLFRGLPRRERRQIAADALKAVGLESRIQHRPSQLSGGQQQRVAIARAIAARPPLILADEPTGSLDRDAADVCMELLGRLHRAGHTVLLITHDPLCAAAARRTVRLEDGRIVTE